MRIFLLYGFLTALALAVWTLLLHALGRDAAVQVSTDPIDYLSLLMAPVFIYAGLRARARGRALPFRTALGTGLGISAVAAVLTVFFLACYYSYVSPAALLYASRGYGLTDASFNQQLLTELGVQLLSVLLAGLLWTLAIGRLIRR
ncbi:DUF4199 domain-containing protein [Hymenobacter sp. BT175]|uniref:DUF4199 domain-containing protein n=1 Tax=Hymenobacter translucens TaxID=2886507 RepID=UPI001D0E8AC4|nr:DUF4199 domain-containing protein [Hymenobacter translucens]MCC2545766.1 DUF4199 domain-containing protein [Hymenobacter translucens]